MKTLHALLALLLAPALHAVTFTVTTTADEFDTPSGANLSLREAVRDAAASGDAIVFAASLVGQTITLTAEIALTKSLFISGGSLGGGVTISGGGATRLFTVGSGRTVTLNMLTLTGGNGAGASFSGLGGAIYNGGTLTLTRCALSGNSGSYAGAIYNGGTLTLTLSNCTLSGNSSTTFGGAIVGQGGRLTLTHCTLSANQATAGGGGMDANGSATVTLTNTIIAGNTAGAGPGPDFYHENGALTASGCLIGNPANSDIANGVNGNITGVNALLAPLGDYGGPTPTMPPLPGSPAIDPAGGATTSTFGTDQRGFTRVRDGDGNGSAIVDIGAVEVQTAFTVTSGFDDGTLGSLRQAVLGAADGATITFASALSGRNITLAAARGEIVLDRGVTIDASSLGGGLTISGGGATRIFSVSSSQPVALKGLTLTCGNGAGAAASGFGGAIYKSPSSSSALTLTQCTLADNFAGNGGGAIYTFFGALTLTQCTLARNTAVNNGGAIITGVGALTLTHCTLAGNSAGLHGGAIYNGHTVTLNNSIVAGSIASADDLYNPLYSTVTILGANIVPSLDNAGGTVNGAGAISTAAPLLASVGYYGGPTPTMPPLPGSPAIDGVPAGSEVAGLATDQRGFPRPVDGDGNGSALVDIGAVEAQTVPTALTVINNLDDGCIGSLRQAVLGVTDGATIVFAPGLSGGTITLAAARGEIVLGSSVTIDASSLPGGLTIAGGTGANRIFTVSSGQTVALKSLALIGGNGDGANSSGNGGAIYNDGGTLTLMQCALYANSASGNGGAIHNDGGTLTLTQCTLYSNHASYLGGAIYAFGPLTLMQCTLAGNSADLHGGAINGGGTLTHCTISGNAANSNGSGGGIYVDDGDTLRLTNCIVAGNTASSGADIRNGYNLTVVGANIVQSLDNSHGGIVDGGGTTSADDPLLGPLSNYGGPTPTRLLKPGSPARNAAAVLSPALASDQRGFPIIGVPDIGAYEAGTFTNYNTWIYETLPATATSAQHASSADYDGDGVTNGNEWLALTDPGNPASVLRVTQSALTGGTLTVTIPSVVGRSYTLEYTTDFTSWTPVGSPTAGTGGPLDLSITNVSSYPKFFVRVRVGP